MMSGHHNANELPVIMLGNAGGQIKTGQTLNYLDNENRQMCRLYLSMMNKMNVKIDSFGDANQALAEI